MTETKVTAKSSPRWEGGEDMEYADYFVGRIHNQEVYDILVNEHEFSIDEAGLTHSFAEGYQDFIAQEITAIYRQIDLFQCPEDTLILFMGTRAWRNEGGENSHVTGHTVLGIGVTNADPYIFRKVDFWRHRVRLKQLTLFKDKNGMVGIPFERLKIDKEFSYKRFYRDKQGLVLQAYTALSKHYDFHSLWGDSEILPHSTQGKRLQLKSPVPPPQRLAEQRPTPKDEPRGGVKHNYSENARNNHKLGMLGEELVLDFERRRLKRENPAYVDRIVHVAKEWGDGYGYDILSFNADGSKRYIEVKTTTQAIDRPFFVTEVELTKSEQCPDSYYLYRVFRANGEPEFYIRQGCISDWFDLAPTEYRAETKHD